MKADGQGLDGLLHFLFRELEAIEQRARGTRLRLQHGEAVTGVSGLIAIENRCRDALAAAESALEASGRRS